MAAYDLLWSLCAGMCGEVVLDRKWTDEKDELKVLVPRADPVAGTTVVTGEISGGAALSGALPANRDHRREALHGARVDGAAVPGDAQRSEAHAVLRHRVRVERPYGRRSARPSVGARRTIIVTDVRQTERCARALATGPRPPSMRSTSSR
jgi:hypothetical protein